MLKMIIPTIMLIPTTWLTPAKWLWPATLAHSLLIAMDSTTWLTCLAETSWSTLNSYVAVDPISIPLLMLTCWLLPLMILASQNHLALEPANRQRTYISLLTSLQFFLILAFSATEMALFYIAFEATLIPTLIIITRWGNQAERITAGVYFLFYTLMASLPLLVALLVLQHHAGSLSILTTQFLYPTYYTSYSNKLWWAGCILAFLVKLPLYGVHLWLPKAHVEAPVAGSMILAAVLLKLGGYGMMRMMAILDPLTKELSYPFIIFALWGLVMMGSTCLRQADLKSMIAYSSVAHMGLVVAGILIQTQWSFTGALILMIAHGLTASALFCLANTNYERTHSWVMLLTRGLQMALPLMTAWWFLATLANLALPPLPNLMAELMVLTALCNWSPWTILFTGAGVLITAAYSLYMFLLTQRGRLPPHIKSLDPSHSREHLVIALHLTPVTLLIFKPELIWTWLI
ncbi:NADH dehydrogenase subunit 4 (mitochondrion) [Lates calcarifer]|uniref:NADH-ubiquinone oxidoreductase chain 4 n=1 Tax=Lates calcarifer TaxID=8187 RepID=Q3IA67_LATCA|nr:NADH dehydrogenase subunit 4 [Lates calcarifer]AAY18960.1 NADH dehydrogenase subunit 4 [Lates calcarifer]